MKQMRLEEVITDVLESIDRTKKCDCWLNQDTCFCMNGRIVETDNNK